MAVQLGVGRDVRFRSGPIGNGDSGADQLIDVRVAEGAVPLGAALAAAAEVRQLPHQLPGAVRQGEDRAHHLHGGHLAF